MKIAVIGIGGTGSAAARFLAAAGHAVVGYEQFTPGQHDRGSSHGESRIIRHTYPDTLYARLMAQAYPLWDALEAQAAGEELFVRCGGLFFGAENSDAMTAAETALRENDLPFEKLSGAEAMTRFPGLRLFPGEVALFERDSGFLRASRCVLANIRLAQDAGAAIRAGARVTGVEETHGSHGVAVRTAANSSGGGESVETFDRAIVTTGAWMGQFFPDLPLRVTRQQIVYLGIGREADAPLFAPSRFPVWIDAGSNYYGFPADGRVSSGVKLALHEPGEPADPDAPRRPPDAEYNREAAAYAAKRLPSLTAEAAYSQTCLYTNTPDEDFVLDWADTDTRNVLFVSGCSGHGFKFTVLLGKIAADLVTGIGWSDADGLRRFSRARFAKEAT